MSKEIHWEIFWTDVGFLMHEITRADLQNERF